MKKNRIFPKWLANVLSLFILFTVDQGCGGSSASKNEQQAFVDTANPIIVADSSRMSIARVDTQAIQKPDSMVTSTVATATPSVILFAGDNYTGPSDTLTPKEYAQGKPLTLAAGNLQHFSATGIRSIKLPVGLCADILYETNNFTIQPGIPVLIPGGLPTPTGNAGNLHLKRININNNYRPGNYTSIPLTFVRPLQVTIYPWTDCYFSTDDPAVPSQIQYIGLKFSTNGQGYNSWGDSVKLSSINSVYFKSYSYQLPAGAHIHIWQSTANGDFQWNYNVDSTNRVFVNLGIHNNAIFKPRNWIGVRFSLQ
jgi:hypothetical protein